MARKKIIFGVGAGVVSTGVDGVVGLLNIHYFLHYLPETVAGFWMLSVTAGGFLMLAQGAISPAVARFTAQQIGGSHGQAAAVRLDSIRRLTLQMVGGLLVSGLLIFLGYLQPVARQNHLGPLAAASWVAYSLGVVCGLDATSRFAVLNGLGEVGWDKVTRIATSLAGAVMVWFSLSRGFGLLGLGLVSMVQNLVMLGLAEYLLHRFGGAALGGGSKRGSFWRRLFEPWGRVDGASKLSESAERYQLVLETAKLTGLALIGYVVMNAGIFVIERRFGPELVSKYAPLVRVGTLLCTVASLIPQTVYPYVARAWATRNYRSHRRLFLGGVGLAVIGYAVGALTVWLLAPVLMPLWLGPGGYLGPKMLGLVLLVFGLLVSNAAFATPVLASIGNAFIGPSLMNLVLVLLLLWPFSGWWGLNGVPLAMFAGSILPAIWLACRSWHLMLNHNRLPSAVHAQ